MDRRLWTALLGLLLLPVGVEAQERRCDIVSQGRIAQEDNFGLRLVIFHDPFTVRCTDGAELRANQGTLNDMSRELDLIGNVFFQDATRSLTADHATYNSSIGRLWAQGNVVFTNRAEGSTIRGPELEYYRVMPDRPVAQVTASQRPHLTLRPRQAREGEPLELDADRVVIYGDDDLTAYGSVVITRPDLRATSGEARYNAATEGLELRQNARITSDDYDLTGEVVTARMTEGALEHIHARTGATLTGGELNVTGADLQLFFEDELLQRTVATSRTGEGESGPRAVARARAFMLEADSLDAILPGQRLQQVVAIGRARGEAIDTTAAGTDTAAVVAGAEPEAAADTAAAPAETRVAAAPAADTAATFSAELESAGALGSLALISRDWIRGDTVIGYFEAGGGPAVEGVEPDTAVVLRRLVASGSAQALYRVQRDQTVDQKAVNYLSGEIIELSFDEGELQVAEVTGMRRGLYLDPIPPGAEPPAPGESAEGTMRIPIGGGRR